MPGDVIQFPDGPRRPAESAETVEEVVRSPVALFTINDSGQVDLALVRGVQAVLGPTLSVGPVPVALGSSLAAGACVVALAVVLFPPDPVSGRLFPLWAAEGAPAGLATVTVFGGPKGGKSATGKPYEVGLPAWVGPEHPAFLPDGVGRIREVVAHHGVPDRREGGRPPRDVPERHLHAAVVGCRAAGYQCAVRVQRGPARRPHGSDGLRPARDHREAVSHGDAHVFVRDDHDLRQAPTLLLSLGVGLHHRREIGPAVGEEVFDATRGKQSEPGIGCRLGFESHGMFGFHAGMVILSHVSPGERSTLAVLPLSR